MNRAVLKDKCLLLIDEFLSVKTCNGSSHSRQVLRSESSGLLQPIELSALGLLTWAWGPLNPSQFKRAWGLFRWTKAVAWLSLTSLTNMHSSVLIIADVRSDFDATARTQLSSDVEASRTSSRHCKFLQMLDESSHMLRTSYEPGCFFQIARQKVNPMTRPKSVDGAQS